MEKKALTPNSSNYDALTADMIQRMEYLSPYEGFGVSQVSKTEGNSSAEGKELEIGPYGALHPSVIRSVPPAPFAAPKESIRVILDRALEHIRSKEYKKAMQELKLVDRQASVSGDNSIRLRALGNLAAVCYFSEKPEQAIEYYMSCLQLTRRLSDKEREIIVLNNIVLILMELKRYDEAHEYCQQQLILVSSTYNRSVIQKRMLNIQGLLGQ